MSTFVITLNNHPQGYIFHSYQQLIAKPKKAKSVPLKPTSNKNTNRLIKQIGLISDIPPIIPQQSISIKENPIQQNPAYEPDEQDQIQQIQYQVNRQNLPQSPAKWYNKEQIHQKQIDHFPQFFSGKGYKTPQLYKSYRNFIIDAFNINPKRYLTLTSCRRVLRGNVFSIMKIFKFLQKSGLINYCISRDGDYTFKQPLIQKILQGSKRLQSCIKKIPQKPQEQQTNELDTDNLTVTVINKSFSRSFRSYCSQCKLICGIVWYSTQDQNQNINICSQCYENLQKTQTTKYIKMDILKKVDSAGKDGKNLSKSNWGLDDNMKLLQFMGNNVGKNWNDLMPQFQTRKSMQDTIIQFMQFPIANFQPKIHKPQKHEQTHYLGNEHISMLKGILDASSYKQINQHEIVEQNKQTPQHMNQFQSYISLCLQKYSKRISNLSQIQNIIQDNTLNIIEQQMVNRIPPVSLVHQHKQPELQDQQYQEQI